MSGRAVLSPLNAKVLRVVTLASSTGRYGGPYDTAVRQMDIWSDGLGIGVVLAGYEADDRPTRMASKAKRIFVRVCRVLPTRGFTGLFSIGMFGRLVRASSQADIVHISLARELVPLTALMIARVRRKAVVVQPHGMLTSRSSRALRLSNLFLRLLIGNAVAFLALTDTEARHLRQAFGRNITIRTLGNPLPPEVEYDTRKTEARRRSAIFVARLHPRKRVCDFIEASRIAQRRRWEDEYVVVGPDGGDLETVLSVRSINFSYEGAIAASAIVPRLKKSSVFVLPSVSEPWGNVLATALAIGMPVVVTNSTALAPLIREYGAGLCVADGDPEALANAVHELLTDTDSFEKCVSGAARLASEHLTHESQRVGLSTAYETALRLRHTA